MDKPTRAGPTVDSVQLVKTTHERTAMLCEECGAAVLIERHAISAGETFVRDQRLVCEASSETHDVWQGFR